MRILLAFASVLTALSTLSPAYAAAPGNAQKGGTCYGTVQAFNCEHLGHVTVKEIYEKGWRVVAYIKEGPNTTTLIIEEQR